ncbi:MAG: hypothetical protein JXQ73_09410 [Phycisphaerae bacterium]|nr:hypothetical protein [Phycisphaerae bacterium]
MNQCFVIMPYGGDDAEKRRHYTGVYQSIIVPAAIAAGLEPKRSDITGEPGNITHDIIRDLSESDTVIADLTGANANVFFELGIRHAFRKSGTVHIVDASHDIPFDVRQYRAIEYSTELADIPEVIVKIVEAIKKRNMQPERPDNPVHDAIPQLPINIAVAGDDALREQLRNAQERMENLHRENEALVSRLGELDASDSVRADSAVDVDALLDEADNIMKSTGEHAVLRLRQAIEEGGSDAFVKVLRGVLKSPYLEENDFMEILILCRQFNLNDHRRATLEVARRRYPYSSAIFLVHVDALDDSPNQADQEKGRLMLEERLGVKHVDGKPEFAGAQTSIPLHESIGLLLNFYNRAEKHEWILSFADSLPDAVSNDPMVVRSRARALAGLNRKEEAGKAFEDALDMDPTDDQTLAWYADFLDDQGKYSEAYATFEKAIIADREDGNLLMNLGIHVLNRGYYRARSGEIEGPLPRKSRARVAVPIMLKAIEVDGHSAGLMQRIVRVLVRGDAVREAEAIAAGNRPEGKYDASAVDYLESQIAEGEHGGEQCSGEYLRNTADGPSENADE